jgi:hypothetical protein
MGAAIDGRVAVSAAHGATSVRSEARHIGRGADQVRRHFVFRAIAHLGLLSRAVVYLLLGALVIEIAVRGRSSNAADSQGAFAAISHWPAGRELLALVALGLAAYALWRFVEAASNSPQGPVTVWTRLGWIAVGLLYIFLCVTAVELSVGSQPQGAHQSATPFAAHVLRLPGGAVLLGVLAAVVAASGVALIVWGVSHGYAALLRRNEMGTTSRRSLRPAGAVGNVARGVSVLLVASFLFSSAVSVDPERAKSLDAALQSLAGSAAGAVLLGGIGAGFLAFSVFSIFEARFRRI